MSFYPTFPRFPRISGYGRPLGPSGQPQGGKTPKPPPAAANEGYWLGCFASDYVCRPCGDLEKPSSSFQLEQTGSHCGSSSFCFRLEKRGGGPIGCPALAAA